MNKLRNLLHPKAIVGGLIAAFIIAAGVGITGPSNAHASACPGHDDDTNAVIRCGFNSMAEFGSKFSANPHGDLQNIYGHFGMTNINNFKNTAVHATIYKTGQIKLDDGTIIATGAQSLGREKVGGNRYAMNIAGHQYWYSSVGDNFGSSSLDGYAQINDDHSLALVIMKACGNPGWGNSPGYKCQMLQQTKVNDTTYHYVATPFTKNGATVSRIVYDFGDGKSQTVTNNFGQTVSHTYAPGDYTARATVFFSVNGQEKSDTRQDCTKPVHVPQPPKPVFYCTELIAKQVDNSRTKFTFTATAFVDNGAVLQSGTFKFDDGTSQTMNAVGKTVTATHEYTAEGNHTTTADLTFNDGKDVGNVKCKVVTKTTPPTCKETPTKPECQTCQNTPTLPECQPPKTCADTPEKPECQPPKNCTTNPEMAECKTIPSTGPEEVVSTVLGLSTVTGAGVYYRNTRRDWLNKIFKR